MCMQLVCHKRCGPARRPSRIRGRPGLRKDCDPQQFGLGIKEVWEVPADHPHFEPGAGPRGNAASASGPRGRAAAYQQPTPAKE